MAPHSSRSISLCNAGPTARQYAADFTRISSTALSCVLGRILTTDGRVGSIRTAIRRKARSLALGFNSTADAAIQQQIMCSAGSGAGSVVGTGFASATMTAFRGCNRQATLNKRHSRQASPDAHQITPKAG